MLEGALNLLGEHHKMVLALRLGGTQRRPLRDRRNMALHIFWDNSNVWGCAQDTREIREPDVPWVALRVHWRNLYALVTRDREVETKCMAGSVPPECDDLWAYARSLGFDISLLRRVESADRRTKEQAVDEVLHAKMANATLDYDPPQTMVLLSGDGKTSQFGLSFPRQLKRALKQGWEVEVHAWEAGFNHRLYDPLLEMFPTQMRINPLDQYYESITFVKEMECYRKDDRGDKIFVTVAPRVVKLL